MLGSVAVSLKDKLREYIPEQVKARLKAKLNPGIVETLEEVATVVKRFIFRFFRFQVDDAISSMSLNQLMKRSVGNTMTCPKAYELIPDELKAAHVVKLLDVIDEHIKVKFIYLTIYNLLQNTI